MFSFLKSGGSRNRDLLPLNDFKIGPFTIGSTSSTPSNEYAYTAVTPSDDSAVDSPSRRDSPQRHSILSLDRFQGVSSPPPGYKPPSYYSTFLGATHRRAKSTSFRCKFLLFLTVVASILYTMMYITFRPPNYIVLPPEKYVDTLKQTMFTIVPSKAAQDSLLDQLAHIQHPDAHVKVASSSAHSALPQSIVPSTIWSSDGKPAPAAWFAKWKSMGFDPKFLDDAGAEAWVEKHYGGTPVKQMWDSMPRFILKADLLRYLLLLDEGGTWSDMDTVPLMHRTNWTKDAIPLSSVLPEDSGIFGRADVASPRRDAMTPEPVRAIIGIENDPNENPSIRNALERWRILPMRRHRPLQFVQWTLHTAPNHPIMLDVLRRILRASEVYKGYAIEQDRDSNADGWGWGEKSVEERKEQTRLREAHIANPWDATHMSWKWEAGNWRWGWNILSVEEWTGPAVWTDSVVSYLYASAGVRPEDLTGLKQPVQIRDVVIVPSNGFNPGQHRRKDGETRLVHLFRGSWKG